MNRYINTRCAAFIAIACLAVAVFNADAGNMQGSVDNKAAVVLPLTERMERAKRLLEAQGYNATNKPSRAVFDRALAQAGVRRPYLPDATMPHATPVMPSRMPRYRRIGSDGGQGGNALFIILSVVGVIALVMAIVLKAHKSRSGSRKDPLPDYYKHIEKCLLSNHAFQPIVTPNVRKEWAVIIKFFTAGDGTHRLPVRAVLFLWEKIFQPQISHADVIGLDERLRRVCGLSEMFSERNFERFLATEIKKHGRAATLSAWRQLCDYAYSISDGIADGLKVDVPDGFGASVYGLLKSWDGKFANVAMLPVDWKLFFNRHPEFAERGLLARYGVPAAGEWRFNSSAERPASKRPEPIDEEGGLSFLDAGKDGEVRAVLWAMQKMVVMDDLSCRLYLPDGWDLQPAIKRLSSHHCLARLAGPRDHEWLAVECLHLSPGHVNDDLGDWVGMSRELLGRLLLNPHDTKAQGVHDCREISFGRLGRRDALYMKYHEADDMASFAGTIAIENHLHRLFIVIVRRGADSWKFEYVFPAADGVSEESLEFNGEEIVSAARVFVPIRTMGKRECAFCGKKVEDPVKGDDESTIFVWMKDFFLFDDMKLPESGCGIPCCDACRKEILLYGLPKARLEEMPSIHDQLSKGASITKVVCGKDEVQLLVYVENSRSDGASATGDDEENDEFERAIKIGEFEKAMALKTEQLRKHPDQALKDLYAKRKAGIASRLREGHQVFLEDYEHHGRDIPERVTFLKADGNFELMLPKSIASTPEVRRTGSLVQLMFKGNAPSEWIYVEHIGIMSSGLRDGEEEMEDRVEFPLQIWDMLPLHCPGDEWAEGVDIPLKQLRGINRCTTDSAYMKYRRLDKMASWVATHSFNNVVNRIFILAVQRGNEGWLVEYVFPALISEREEVVPGMTVWRVRPPTEEEARLLDNNISHADCDKAQVVLGSFTPDGADESDRIELKRNIE